MPKQDNEDTAPKRKKAPEFDFRTLFKSTRTDILRKLDEAYPEFVHMYQHPKAAAGDANLLWDMEQKGQEFVKNPATKRIVTHKVDPVVRQNRAEWDAERKAESEQSRTDVEAVVKTRRSTVHRKRKEPIEMET